MNIVTTEKDTVLEVAVSIEVAEDAVDIKTTVSITKLVRRKTNLSVFISRKVLTKQYIKLKTKLAKSHLMLFTHNVQKISQQKTENVHGAVEVVAEVCTEDVDVVAAMAINHVVEEVTILTEVANTTGSKQHKMINMITRIL